MNAVIERLSTDTIRVKYDDIPDTHVDIRGTNEAIGTILMKVLVDLAEPTSAPKASTNGNLITGPWSPAEVALLGTDKDRVVAEKLHRATANVTAKRIYEEAKAAKGKRRTKK